MQKVIYIGGDTEGVTHALGVADCARWPLGRREGGAIRRCCLDNRMRKSQGHRPCQSKWIDTGDPCPPLFFFFTKGTNSWARCDEEVRYSSAEYSVVSHNASIPLEMLRTPSLFPCSSKGAICTSSDAQLRIKVARRTRQGLIAGGMCRPAGCTGRKGFDATHGTALC